MPRLILLLALLWGCSPPATVAPVRDDTEVAALREKLSAAERERDDLAAKMVEIRAKVDEIGPASQREQKLAIGRYLIKMQIRDSQIGVGSMNDAELAHFKPILVRLRNGGPVTADEYWELEKRMVAGGGSLPEQWLVNVDWMTNPEIKRLIDDLSREIHKESVTSYAARLNSAANSDEKAMLFFERQMELLGEPAKDIIR